MKRVGLLGVGVMGSNHVRVLHSLPEYVIVGVVDTADRHIHLPEGVTRYEGVEELLTAELDLVVISTPAGTHAQLALQATAHGVPCLVEKPLATSASDCTQIINSFTKSKNRGWVAHLERFNPSIQAARELLARGHFGTPIQHRAQRFGPHPGRSLGVGVALDLMVHDIDLAAWMYGHQLTVTETYAAFRHDSRYEDMAGVLGHTLTNVLIHLEANWLSPCKRRRTEILTDEGLVVADSLESKLTYFRSSSPGTQDSSVPSSLARPGVEVTEFSLVPKEPLVALYEELARALEGGQSSLPSIQEGAATVAIAEEVVARCSRIGASENHSTAAWR